MSKLFYRMDGSIGTRRELENKLRKNRVIENMADCGDTFEINGDVTYNGNVTIRGNLNVTKNLNVTGIITSATNGSNNIPKTITGVVNDAPTAGISSTNNQLESMTGYLEAYCMNGSNCLTNNCINNKCQENSDPDLKQYLNIANLLYSIDNMIRESTTDLAKTTQRTQIVLMLNTCENSLTLPSNNKNYIDPNSTEGKWIKQYIVKLRNDISTWS
jgi:hypothetical protein